MTTRAPRPALADGAGPVLAACSRRSPARLGVPVAALAGGPRPAPRAGPPEPWSCSSTGSVHELLARRGGHAPFLRSLLPSAAARARRGFPSTTATSVRSFGTGLAAGTHGLIGYEASSPRPG